MKTIFLLIGAIATLLLPAHGDILANSDFHNANANWKGDRHAAGEPDTNDSSSIDHASDAKGVILTLKPAHWTKFYQAFDSQDESLCYTVTYQLSADYAPQGVRGGGMMPSRPNPPTLTGMPAPRNAFLSAILEADYSGILQPPTGNDFLLLVVDLTDGSYSSSLIHPTMGKTDPQPTTSVLSDVPPHDEKTFYLIFSTAREASRCSLWP